MKSMPIRKPENDRNVAAVFAERFADINGVLLHYLPVLVLTGEKASINFLIEQAKLVSFDIRGQVVHGSGHWLMEEAPQTVISAVTTFTN